MAKKQDFSSKVNKQKDLGNVCSVCETPYTMLQKVDSLYSEETRSYKYSARNIKVCKCNENAVYA